MRIFLPFVIACKPMAPLAPPHCERASTALIDTEDGAQIALHHHSGAGPPVILVHGISSNHHFWDLTEQHSMPELLVDAGFDTWAVDLRGHGDAMKTEAGIRQRHGWTIDDYGKHDLHAAITHVQTVTGHAKVAVVGHSMGGMVAAAYNGHHGDDAISALVVVGSPISFEHQDFLTLLGRTGLGIGSLWTSFGTQRWAAMASRMSGPLPIHGEGVLYNAKNMKPEMRRYMLDHIVSPVSREELRHFQVIFKQRRFTSVDGQLDYPAQLRDLDAPLLVVAGSGDQIAPIETVEAWIEHSGSDDETFMAAGEANGFAFDYGHLDLVLGDHAREEVLNPIASWLESRLLKAP